MINIFTYGSLMFDQVWTRIVDGTYLKTEAILKGYDRKGIRGEVYPAIFPSSRTSRVQGIVYFNISSADMGRLDIFEGEYYFRRAEQVITRDRGIVPAFVYVLKEEYYPVITHQDWDAERFEKTGLPRFTDNYINSVHDDKRMH